MQPDKVHDALREESVYIVDRYLEKATYSALRNAALESILEP